MAEVTTAKVTPAELRKQQMELFQQRLRDAITSVTTATTPEGTAAAVAQLQQVQAEFAAIKGGVVKEPELGTDKDKEGREVITVNGLKKGKPLMFTRKQAFALRELLSNKLDKFVSELDAAKKAAPAA